MQDGRAERIGVFGGSFDPVHFGHVRVAECCQRQAQLDFVWLAPTAQQPLKPSGPAASPEDRVAMLELAVGDRADWGVSRVEIDRGGVSYTVDTLREIRRLAPKAELFFMMGADSLVEFPRWKGPAEICRLATLLVVRRPNSQPPDLTTLSQFAAMQGAAPLGARLINMTETPISSSELRGAIAHGEADWRTLTPPEVARYIESRGLYRPAKHD
ncbi:MAG: nicotinate-nucleotide adenylyltransferase [Planctomycetota bacterium]